MIFPAAWRTYTIDPSLMNDDFVTRLSKGEWVFLGVIAVVVLVMATLSQCSL